MLTIGSRKISDGELRSGKWETALTVFFWKPEKRSESVRFAGQKKQAIPYC